MAEPITYLNMKKPVWLIISVLITAGLLHPAAGFAQIDTVTFDVAAELLFPSFPVKSSYASLFDKRDGQHYLYSANMEFGLGIYDTADPTLLSTVQNLGIATFDNLDVSTVEQRNNSLFVGIGDFQVKDNVASGLAILDITDPETPVVKDIWDSTAFQRGISHLIIDGDYAYLTTMKDGLLILRVQDENHIQFVSSLQLDLSFPAPSGNAHNARGLQIRNDTLYVCFDRGGLRLVDVTDKQHPVEIYQYVNPVLNASAGAAYNDIALKGHFAFVSVDYCGLEVLDIGAIPFTSVLWYNPWNCNFTNWSGAAIHTNELILANNDSLLFVTGGQSELFVFDVTDPETTVKIGEFVNLYDTLATSGLDVYDNRVSLSFLHTPVHIPPFTPFFSDPGGLKILDYQVDLLSSGTSEKSKGGIRIFPNPATDRIVVEAGTGIEELTLFDLLGRELVAAEFHQTLERVELPIQGALPGGVYFVKVKISDNQVFTKKIVLKN